MILTGESYIRNGCYNSKGELLGHIRKVNPLSFPRSGINPHQIHHG